MKIDKKKLLMRIYGNETNGLSNGKKLRKKRDNNT